MARETETGSAESRERDGLVAEFIEQRQFLEVFHGCYAVVKLIE